MTNVIIANARENVGKGAARASRREGNLPAVIYGAKKKPVAVNLKPIEIEKLVKTGSFFNTVFEIDVDGKVEKVLPRDFSVHPVKGYIEHVDFLRVKKGAKIKVNVPINYIGIVENRFIKMGGKLQIVYRDLPVVCSIDSIPSTIDIDITNYKFNNPVRISAFELPKGVIANFKDKDQVIASIKAPRGVTSAEAAAMDEQS